MKSSLEIAQEADLLPIESIAEQMGLTPDEFEPYGRYKAKISLDVVERMKDAPDAKIVCVAGVTPTKAGDSAFIAPDQKTFKFKVTADKGSTLHYYCGIHAWMQGKIKVN